ncbi:MAG: Ig-like domain-containing protein, partial [Patescibacteria group bacterium]
MRHSRSILRLWKSVSGFLLVSLGIATWTPAHIAEGQVVQGIAQQYPCDAGLQNDPAVIFTENFEENSIGTMAARWNDNDNTGGMSFSSDVPATSGGSQSLRMTAVGGSTTGGYLYKNFAPAGYDTLYVRYYVKFPSNFPGLHHLVTLGGRNPASNFPIGSAGTQPTGSDRFSSSVEPSGNPFVWDFYTYWMHMRSWNGSQYFGNGFNPSPTAPLTTNDWFPVEFMIKLNSPVSSFNGEQAMWLNGLLKQHLTQGSPLGNWSSDEFFPNPSGSPFEGFQWRNTTALNINYLWFQYYHETGANGATDSLSFDDVVVATEYIGPMVACGAQGGDTTPPSVSLTAPAASATVSGAAVTVSATATDNVGVSGVQFRLDGTDLGTEDTSAPYSLSWDTTGVSNGSHTLTAVARDAAGNTTTATNVAVTVSNTGQFTINDRVRVTALLNVRATPGGTLLGNHDTDALATVVGGPIQQGGSTWWDLDYDVAPD